MKAYKIRSLIYLSCFVFAAVVYYQIEQDEKFQNSLASSQTTDIQIEDEPAEDAEVVDTPNLK